MSREVHVRFCERREVRSLPATHLVVCVAGREEHAMALRAEVEQVLAPLGLRLSPEKTRVVSIDDGFDFLGFAIKRVRGRHGRMVIHTYPSKRALASVKAKVRQITKHTGPDQAPDQLLHRVNAVLRGWCNYFRHGVSSRTFAYLRHYAYWRVVGWLRRRHRKRNWSWLRRTYLTERWPARLRPLNALPMPTNCGSRARGVAELPRTELRAFLLRC